MLSSIYSETLTRFQTLIDLNYSEKHTIQTMKNNQAGKQKSAAREYTEAIVIALILAFFIRTFIVQAFKIPSGSMLQTLFIGDHILVSKFIYGIKNPFSGSVLIPIKSPKRGDIVVFKYPKDPKLDYIKRVVATAGDTVEIKDKKFLLTVHRRNIATENSETRTSFRRLKDRVIISVRSLCRTGIFSLWETTEITPMTADSGVL